jgi:hypothetical protein
VIRNDQELAAEVEALGHIERALESLRSKLMPHNPKNFALYSEGYVEQIDLLKSEIDAYLAKRTARDEGAATANLGAPVAPVIERERIQP